MEIIKIGEKLHIIERRYFETDPRRHFLGEVVAVENDIIRIRGYVWVYGGGLIKFIKRPELRERVLIIGERMTINVIPAEVNLDDVQYVYISGKGLIMTDNKQFSLDITEFSTQR